MNYINVDGHIFEVTQRLDAPYFVRKDAPKIYTSYLSALEQGSYDLMQKKLMSQKPLIIHQKIDYPKFNYRIEKKEEGKNEIDDWCFITTACVTAKNLGDDCDILRILRYFRDSYFIKSKNKFEDLLEYYKIAPSIVRSINIRSNSKEIYEQIYKRMIIPAVNLVLQNELNKAYGFYKPLLFKW